MDEKVYSIINRNQLDTLVKKIQKRYVKEHPDTVYAFKDCAADWGTKEEMIFYSFRTKLALGLMESFKYPKGYKPEDDTSKSLISFIVRKDGTADNIVIKSFFNHLENRKLNNYFEKSISDYIMKSDLRIPTSFGIPVNCQMDIVLVHR